jgi:hypothetical protein
MNNFSYDPAYKSMLKIFNEAEEDKTEKEDDTFEKDNPSQIEIAPPSEESEEKNSDYFVDGKVSNFYIDNDPSIHNLIDIVTADMEDKDRIKGYVEVLFTRLGINDVDPEKFKLFSSEIWEKLENLTEMDPKTALAEFSTWAVSKVNQFNR